MRPLLTRERSELSNADPVMWIHGYVRCGRCGYDSLEANEVHVYEEGRASRTGVECPRCRSLECAPVDVDAERGLAQPEGPDIFRCPAPEGLTIMNALVVFDCADAEGESVIVVQADEGMRDSNTLGLLEFGRIEVEHKMYDEFRGSGR